MAEKYIARSSAMALGRRNDGDVGYRFDFFHAQ